MSKRRITEKELQTEDRTDQREVARLLETEWTIADLTVDLRNARKRGPRATGMLEASLQEVGAARSIVIDEAGRILAGNGTVEAAGQVGIERVKVVDADGEELVAVRRRGLTERQKRRLAVLDNRTGELAEWDTEVLAALAADGLELNDLWAQDELDALFGDQSGNVLSLADVPRPFSDEQIISSAFTYFRATGFPYRKLPIHVCMQEINKLGETDPASLLNTDTAYHVADTYHPHRYHATAEGMRSQYEAFCDDGLLRRALELELEYGSIGERSVNKLQIVHGTQPLSNFRPGFASLLYRTYCEPGMTVLDTSTGYGGRLVGFMASGIAGRYIGIDPNTPTHDGNLRMAADLGFAEKVELINLPAEDVPHEALRGRCDFAFTSPPYFAKEHYSDDSTQSWVRYRTGEEWREGFLVPMMRLQFAALKPGSTAIVNIADVKIRNQQYPLARWTCAAGEDAGFEFVKQDGFALTRRFGAGQADEVAVEPVLIFRKPEPDA